MTPSTQTLLGLGFTENKEISEYGPRESDSWIAYTKVVGENTVVAVAHDFESEKQRHVLLGFLVQSKPRALCSWIGHYYSEESLTNKLNQFQ
jgi:hypothetical protein